jgi:hypothetical protein
MQREEERGREREREAERGRERQREAERGREVGRKRKIGKFLKYYVMYVHMLKKPTYVSARKSKKTKNRDQYFDFGNIIALQKGDNATK